jgi:hypothetical protein
MSLSHGPIRAPSKDALNSSLLTPEEGMVVVLEVSGNTHFMYWEAVAPCPLMAGRARRCGLLLAGGPTRSPVDTTA